MYIYTKTDYHWNRDNWRTKISNGTIRFDVLLDRKQTEGKMGAS